MARLFSVNVGLTREISWHGDKVFTSVWKQPVQGRRQVRRLNVDGDGQGTSRATAASCSRPRGDIEIDL